MILPTLTLALTLLALASPPQGSTADVGLVALAPQVAKGTGLHPPGGGFTAQAPAGWAWYRQQALPEDASIYVAAPRKGDVRLVLTAGGSSAAGEEAEVIKELEGDLRQLFEGRGAVLKAFSYSEAPGLRGVLRYSATASHPRVGERFVLGYIHLGQPTITLQAIVESSQEPPQLRAVAASIRRNAPGGQSAPHP